MQRFSYLLVPHDGDWRRADLTRAAAVLGAPPRAMLESFHDGTLPAESSFADDGAGQVMITAFKGSEDPGPDGADLIVRAVETTAGRRGHSWNCYSWAVGSMQIRSQPGAHVPRPPRSGASDRGC